MVVRYKSTGDILTSNNQETKNKHRSYYDEREVERPQQEVARSRKERGKSVTLIHHKHDHMGRFGAMIVDPTSGEQEKQSFKWNSCKLLGSAPEEPNSDKRRFKLKELAQQETEFELELENRNKNRNKKECRRKQSRELLDKRRERNERRAEKRLKSSLLLSASSSSSTTKSKPTTTSVLADLSLSSPSLTNHIYDRTIAHTRTGDDDELYDAVGDGLTLATQWQQRQQPTQEALQTGRACKTKAEQQQQLYPQQQQQQLTVDRPQQIGQQKHCLVDVSLATGRQPIESNKYAALQSTVSATTMDDEGRGRPESLDMANGGQQQHVVVECGAVVGNNYVDNNSNHHQNDGDDDDLESWLSATSQLSRPTNFMAAELQQSQNATTNGLGINNGTQATATTTTALATGEIHCLADMANGAENNNNSQQQQQRERPQSEQIYANGERTTKEQEKLVKTNPKPTMLPVGQAEVQRNRPPFQGHSEAEGINGAITGELDHNSASSRAERRVARISRPGRSPISLQRSTNARLTRHKLKIQQQRQEQLANLAVRERSRLNGNATHLIQQATFNYQPSSQVSNSQWASIAADNRSSHIESDNRRRERSEINLDSYRRHQHNQRVLQHLNDNGEQTIGASIRHSLLESIVARLRPLWWGSSSRNLNIAAAGNGNQNFRLTSDRNHNSNHRPQQNQQQQQQRRFRNHQQQVPSARQPSPIAIEICDNQAACSSGRLAARGNDNSSNSNNNYSDRRHQFSASGNVIVYRSIDMLRNASSSSSYGQLGRNSRNEAMALHNNSELDTEDDSEDSKTICSSMSSLNSNKPFCKICHLGSSKSGDKLISPCKCSGTMQFIHCGCLLKWLEISNRTNEKPMSCELCAHEYTWHKKFNYQQVQLPKCSLKDTFLHIIFIAAIGLMLFCALAPILCKNSTPANNNSIDSNISNNPASLVVNSNNNNRPALPEITSNNHRSLKPSAQQSTSFGGRHNGASNTFINGYSNHLASSRLAHDEKFMLMCAAFFFMSFFLAIYVQTKARDTLYGLLVKFISMNQTYYITEYDHGHQPESTSISPNNNTSNNNSNNNSGKQVNHQQQQPQQPQQQQELLTSQLNDISLAQQQDQTEQQLIRYSNESHLIQGKNPILPKT